MPFIIGFFLDMPPIFSLHYVISICLQSCCNFYIKLSSLDPFYSLQMPSPLLSFLLLQSLKELSVFADCNPIFCVFSRHAIRIVPVTSDFYTDKSHGHFLVLILLKLSAAFSMDNYFLFLSWHTFISCFAGHHFSGLSATFPALILSFFYRSFSAFLNSFFCIQTHLECDFICFKKFFLLE